jgi:hypothetical protein
MRMRSHYLPVSLLVGLFLIAVFVLAPRSSANVAQDPPSGTPPAGGQERPTRPEPSAEPKPYDRVITKEAKSDEGIFTVHTIKEKVYYEIPRNLLRSFAGRP